MTTGLIKGTEKEYMWRQKRRYWHERDNRKGKGDDKGIPNRTLVSYIWMSFKKLWKSG
jgi:hypothetical protein